MSEFARQAHPDAAHRERLSREIPGLSPRQVQVWFQNRRAKLKRLITEDRERMMRSRALPENFDMSHALNAGFGTGGPGSASPMASPAGFQPTMQPPGHMRPLTLDTLRRGVPEQSFASPTGISPAMNALAFTPPQSATDTTSPMSAVSDMSSFAYTHRALAESPRRNPFPGSVPGLSGQPSQYIPRMHIQDRFRRQSADAVSSPLRSSMSYGSLNMEDIRAHEHGQAATISEEPTNYEFQRDTPRNMPPPPLTPYGLGIPYTAITGMHTNVPTPSSQQVMTTAPGPDMQSYQRDTQQQYMGQQTATYPHFQGYQNAGYTVPQMPQYSYAPNFNPQQYQGQFAPPPGVEGPALTAPLPSQHQQYGQLGTHQGREGEESEGDNSDGGVPLPAGY
ncbi:hypothetical protein M8818_007775 [Zalaria obscura]|uniref:Uncharacterized protein n=1 Tax=Zalaria obscura TaxID=2024903 RepID=A0ACC3S3J2_9PEZI